MAVAGAAEGAPKGAESHPSPFVRLPCEGYPLSNTAREIGAILKSNGVFRRDSLPVTINRESGSVEVMSADRFRSYVEKHMVTGKVTYTKEGTPLERPMSMGREVATGVLCSDVFIEQQRLIVKVNKERMPVVRADGRLELLAPGYDVESRTFTLPTALQIDEEMGMDQARSVVLELLKEFPFGDFKDDSPENKASGMAGQSRSRSVHISNMVSLYGAGLLSELSNRLHFVYVANAQRSGKTLLAKTAVVPIFGPSKVKSLPKDDNELRKMLDAAALSNAPYFFLDDLEGMLKSTELNAFMTAPTWSNRKMNTQTDFAAAKQTVVIITGNNLGLSTDLANRTLRCSLYTEEFDAQNRQIHRVIDEEYLAREEVRREVLSALWCFVREWYKAGRPQGKRVLRGFEAWCLIFGGIVAHAGFGDPIEPPPQDDYSGDTEGADMLTLVESLVADMDKGAADGGAVKKKEYAFDELVDAAHAQDCFAWMMNGTKKRDKDSGDEWLELDQRSKSSLGKMFAAKYGGRKFRLKDGRVARFGNRGRNRHRRYLVEVV
jgi:hypothetical protein